MIPREHEAFARALVALCRDHGVGSITAIMSMASSRHLREKPDLHRWPQVTIAWNEGRHGDQSMIGFSVRADTKIPELPAGGGPADPTS